MARNKETYKLRLSAIEINTVVSAFLKANPCPKGPLAIKIKICEAQILKILDNYTLVPKEKVVESIKSNDG